MRTTACITSQFSEDRFNELEGKASAYFGPPQKEEGAANVDDALRVASELGLEERLQPVDQDVLRFEKEGIAWIDIFLLSKSERRWWMIRIPI